MDRSETEMISYTAEQKAEILKLASNQERGFEYAESMVTLSAPFSPPILEPTSPLGHNLGRLPMELLTYICQDLDLTSAVRFSHVNRRAKAVTSSVFEYRILREHAAYCMRQMFMMNLGPRFTIKSLFSALTTNRCECGALASYVMLPTLTRPCKRCLRRHGNTVHVWAVDKDAVTDGSKRTMFKVNCFSVASTYLTLTLDRAQFDLNSFQRPAADSYYTGPYMRTYTREQLLDGPLAVDKVNPADRRIFMTKSPKGRVWRATFSVTVLLPFYDKRNRVARRPRICNACSGSIDIASWAKTYTDEEFIKHFDECEETQKNYKLQIREIRGGTATTPSRFLDSDEIWRLLEESQD